MINFYWKLYSPSLLIYRKITLTSQHKEALHCFKFIDDANGTKGGL